MPNPLVEALQKQGFLVLDGGFGTGLERRGKKLQTRLWSAALARTDPGEIVRLHRSFLEAGADVIIASSYQASIDGFCSEFGCTPEEGLELLKRTVALAVEARDTFWKECGSEDRVRPLVAASVGCYGGYLAGGQEFTADYGKPHLSLSALCEPQSTFRRGEAERVMAGTVALAAAGCAGALRGYRLARAGDSALQG